MAKKNVVENKPASVSNVPVVDHAVNKAVQEATRKVFDNLLRLEKIEHIADDVAALMIQELRNQSFMTEQLELTKAQETKLVDFAKRACATAKDRYLGNIKKDERTKSVSEIVELAMQSIVHEALASIGQEINRGAVIAATAVKADAKKDTHNQIELNYPKEAGDITIPTKGVFISTNCVQVIQDSCTTGGGDPKTQLVNADTGEIIELDPDEKDES